MGIITFWMFKNKRPEFILFKVTRIGPLTALNKMA
jgi:hypothetical protein